MMTFNWFWSKQLGFVLLEYKCCVEWS